MSVLSDRCISRYLAPSKEEQVVLILQGKCPHNQQWVYGGHSHETMHHHYRCILCSEWRVLDSITIVE